MNAAAIYQLASEMTEQQVLNVLAGWENKNETKSIESYKGLVRLGDSIQLACATVMIQKSDQVDNNEAYRLAYEN